MRSYKGQSSIEYIVVIVVVIGVFLTMSPYIKRGISGRWKTAVDDLGDQYDPNAVNSLTVHTTEGNSLTSITTINAQGGFWTSRYDNSSMIENRTGFTYVDP